MARLFQYGISLSHYKADHLDNATFLNYNTKFSLELPENVEVGSQYRGRVKSICQLFPVSLTKSIAEQSPRIVDGFINQLHALIEKYDGRPITFVLDLDLEKGIDDEAAFTRRYELLKRLSHKLYYSTVTIALAVRIPTYSPKNADICLKYLMALSMERFQLCVDIHPHEIGRDPDCDVLLQWVKFDLAVVRLVYVPEGGNKLVTKAVRPWCEALEKSCYNRTLFFAPIVTSEQALFDEINNCATIVDELKKV